LLVEAKGGDVTNSFEIPYPDLPATIGAYATCPFSTVASEVRVSRFTLVGGSPAQPDEFVCDSRKPG
jgi:hypothetical protein